MNKPDNISVTDWNLIKKKYKNIDIVEHALNHGYPIQYLIGNVNFYGYKINVNKNVLIPRFETEGLVEKTINYIKEKNLEKSSLLDIGTGSGAIAISLKKEIPKLEVTALDVSLKALRVAKRNAKLNKAEITFVHKNLFRYDLINKYDVIISNPPYIEENSDYDESILFEPSIAIFVKDKDPLIYYRKILDISLDAISDNHIIAFEIDEDHGQELKKLAKEYYPKDKIVIEKDLANKNRYLFIISK